MATDTSGYKSPEELGATMATIQEQYLNTADFADIKGCDQDTVRRAARRGDIEATKLFDSVLVFKHPDFSEKNAGWEPGESSGRGSVAREDDRLKYIFFLNDDELKAMLTELGGDETETGEERWRDPRKRARKRREAKADEAEDTDEQDVEDEDELDVGPAQSNPFAGFGG